MPNLQKIFFYRLAKKEPETFGGLHNVSKKETDAIRAKLEEVQVETEAKNTDEEHKAKRRKIAEEVSQHWRAMGVPMDDAAVEKIVELKLKLAAKSDKTQYPHIRGGKPLQSCAGYWVQIAKIRSRRPRSRSSSLPNTNTA